MQMLLNGAVVTADLKDSLSRAVIISLFTWRRADSSDDVDPMQSKQGWWGDSFSEDKIGSRLWLILREKITDETLARGQEYAREALQWLIDDGLAEEVNVTISRNADDYNRIDLHVEVVADVKAVYEFKSL